MSVHGVVIGSIFCVGECIVDTRSNSLLRHGRLKRIEPKLMDVLCVLANHQGQVVLREELRAQAWTDVVVGDDAVNRAIFALRNALGDDAKAPRYIETISKKGYRLCCEVSPFKPEQELLPHAIPNNAAAAPITPPKQKRLFSRLPTSALWLGGTLFLGFIIMMTYGGWHWLGASPQLAIGKIMPITHIEGSEISMALNPETDDYAYIHNTGDRTRLYIQPANGAAPLRITDDYETVKSPKWLNVNRLVYVSCSGLQCAIYLYQQGTDIQKIYANQKEIFDLNVDLADNSTVFFSERQGKGKIKRLHIETSEVVVLRDAYPQLPEQAYARVYRAEDEALIYSASLGAGVVIKQLHLKDGVITDWKGEFNTIADIKMCWDKTLLVAGEFAGVKGIWRMKSNEHLPDLVLMASGAESIVNLEVNKRTREVFYSTHQGNLDLNFFSKGMSTFDPLPTLNSDMNDNDGVFSNDGRYVYFVSDRSGSKEIWQYSMATESIRQITQLHATVMGRAAISYNNQLLAIGYESDSRGIAVVAIDSGKVMASRTIETYQYPLGWSKDGKNFYASEYNQGFSVHQYNAKTLMAGATYKNAWLSVSEVGQSTGLMFPIYGQSKLNLYDFEHGATRELNVAIPNFDELALGHFVLSEDAAFGLGFEGANIRVIKYPYDGAAAITTLDLPPWTWVTSIRNDGLAVLAGKQATPRGAIMKFTLQCNRSFHHVLPLPRLSH